MVDTIIIIKNYDIVNHTIQDLGITFDASSQITLSEYFDDSDIIDSNDLDTLINSGDLVVNNGTKDLNITDGIRHVNYQTELEDIEREEIYSDSTGVTVLGGIEIQQDSTTVLGLTKIINFEGSVDVQETDIDKVTVNVTADEIKQVGITNLVLNDTDKTVTFSTPFTDSNYILDVTITNITDSPPSIYLLTVTSKLSTGFTVDFSGTIDSNNYKLEWMAIKKADRQSGIIAIPNAASSRSITLNTPFTDTSYSIGINLLNSVDATVSIYGAIVSSKSNSGFTIDFSDNIDSANYYLEWSAIK